MELFCLYTVEVFISNACTHMTTGELSIRSAHCINVLVVIVYYTFTRCDQGGIEADYLMVHKIFCEYTIILKYLNVT